ncbi:MAG: YafY family protein [Chloroflexota bacterium]|nr:YafY family protein [Chloroflexota bacterium]
MGNVATRLLSLIMLLQSRPSWKAAELATELSVSERTVHRYMVMLEEMGIPVYSERGPYGGFSLVRGYKLPPLIFTAEEATVLYMGANLIREVWGQTYDDAVTAVTAKLDNVLPDDLRQEVARVRQSLVIGGLTARDYRPWEPMIHVLRRCIGERRCVCLLYRALRRQEDTERVLEPYALTLQWGLWYLVGFCRLRQGMRTFRVDRIQDLVPLEEQFILPRDFSVREYVERTMQFEPSYSVVVRLEAGVASQVRERHDHWMEITDQYDGSITARFGVANLDWTTGWVLSYGAAAKVLEPQELVARVREAAEGALRRYEVEPASAD